MLSAVLDVIGGLHATTRQEREQNAFESAVAEDRSQPWKALESVQGGIAVLDRNRHVHYANGEAERVVQDTTYGLAIRDGLLVATDAEDDAHLSKLILEATHTRSQRKKPRSGGLSIRNRSGKSLALAIAPITRGGLPGRQGHSSALALALIREISMYSAGSADLLGGMFQLTPAEARVAIALAEGMSTREMSEAFHLSLETVRFQLKRAFEKTDTHRQADLVRLVMGLTAEKSTPPAS